jgi:hypothetical protein
MVEFPLLFVLQLPIHALKSQAFGGQCSRAARPGLTSYSASLRTRLTCTMTRGSLGASSRGHSPLLMLCRGAQDQYTAETQLKTAMNSKHTHARLVGTVYIGVRRRSILSFTADTDDTSLTLRKGELAGSSSLRRGPSSTVKPFRQNVMVCTARSGAASTGGSSVAGVASAPSVLSAHS